MNKTLILEFEELRYISIECKQCKTKLTFDMKSPNSRIPGACPSCSTSFDLTSVQGPLGQLKDIYKLLCAIEHRITIDVPILQPSDEKRSAPQI